MIEGKPGPCLFTTSCVRRKFAEVYGSSAKDLTWIGFCLVGINLLMVLIGMALEDVVLACPSGLSNAWLTRPVPTLLFEV